MKRREMRAMFASLGGWGRVASTTTTRYVIEKPDKRRGPHWCPYRACPNKATQLGMANGVALVSGCEFHVAAWVRDPLLSDENVAP